MSLGSARSGGRARTAMMRYLTVRRVPGQISATEPACGDVHYVADGSSGSSGEQFGPEPQEVRRQQEGFKPVAIAMDPLA